MSDTLPFDVGVPVESTQTPHPRGDETAGSDIDLMLVGEVDFVGAVRLLHPAQAELGREINPKVFSAAEFAEAAATPFMRDVLARPKIFLIGDDHELAELARREP